MLVPSMVVEGNHPAGAKAEALPTMPTQTLVPGGEVNRWEQAIYAFLSEKERGSGSGRTVQAYSRMLLHFSVALGKARNR